MKEFEGKPKELTDAVEITREEYLALMESIICGDDPIAAEKASRIAQMVINQEGILIQRFYFSVTRGYLYIPRRKGKMGYL